MITFRRVAAVAAIALASTANSAVAHHAWGDCSYSGFVSVRGWRDGILVGYASGGPDVTINCWVAVDGAEAPSTTVVRDGAYTVDYVSFWAADGSTISVCSQVSSSHGTVTSCGEF